MVLFKIAEGYVLKFNTAACNFPVGKSGIFTRQINGCLQNFCDTPVRGSCTKRSAKISWEASVPGEPDVSRNGRILILFRRLRTTELCEAKEQSI